ncbi:hypothetical protein [Croceicoccus sp. YJ47]|uniref:hypothetical protein n=1 Tax=Croceicoccus sp. YJ47 TaxID=2798724 RepID=UPI001924887C|nr:hypothetical protein [Croceicoccus sp. YJ47]QQN75023.1 hypothetical protein JD971_04825 [Croceicoccus sp. YJ47]
MPDNQEDTLRTLISNLRKGRCVLKSGEYDGADLMRAYSAMGQAADAIEASLAPQDGTPRHEKPPRSACSTCKGQGEVPTELEMIPCPVCR